MRETRHVKTAVVVCALAIACMALALTACGGTPGGQTEEPTGTVEPTGTAGVVADMYARMAERAERYAPKVVTLGDGTEVQRTPSEYDSGIYHQPGETISYNTYYLDADNRGCNACHADLAETLNGMDYAHADLSNPYGIQITAQTCKGCHNPGSYDVYYVTEEYGFGTLVHGLHYGTSNPDFTGDCMSCHNATEDGKGMVLWDAVKHELLRGIVDVPDVTGDFEFTQDMVTSAEDLFNYAWLYYDNDYLRIDNEAADAARSEADYAGWNITVTGAVDKETTWTLADLIAQAPSVTTTMTLQCTQNPAGGPYIGNSVVTGIPLDWLLEKAGASPSTTCIMAISSDGFAEPILTSNFEGYDAYLVYQIDGKPLRWVHGYPVQLWVEGTAAPAFVKQLSEIVIYTDPEENFYQWNGWEDRDGGYYNKPNAGIFYTHEGQVIKVGEPYTFEGYAHGYDEAITAIEFSMDGGTTWTRFNTAGATAERWVTWKFAFTPENQGAYVLHVRSVSDTGRVTKTPIEIMVNAKS